MLDETMGPALATALSKGEFAPALDLYVQFFNPATVGKIKAFGKIEKKGKEVCYLSGELRQNGNVVAKATATSIIRKMKIV
jgi:acyl-coenzyme A thioesterase PaaI-like protein